MIASQVICKGSKIFSEECFFIDQTEDSKGKTFYCSNCLCFIDDINCQIELSKLKLSNGAIRLQRNSIANKCTAIVKCPNTNCADAYCSISCLQNHNKSYNHSFVCSGTNCFLTKEFYRHAKSGANGTIFLAFKLVNKILSDIVTNGCCSTLSMMIQEILSAYPVSDNNKKVLSDLEKELLLESYVLLIPLLSSDQIPPKVLDLCSEDWIDLNITLSVNLHYLFIDSPIATVSQSLHCSTVEQEQLFDALEPFADSVMATDISQKFIDEPMNSEFLSLLTGLNTMQLRNRKKVRLAQAAASHEDDNPFRSFALSCACLLPKISTLRHNCLPNAQPELVWTDATDSSADDTRLRVQLIALRDVDIGEELCCSRIDYRLPLGGRSAALEKLQGVPCECARCKFESRAGTYGQEGYPRLQLGISLLVELLQKKTAATTCMHLAELDMQLGRWAGARQLFASAIELEVFCIGNAYHGLGAACMESGLWREAREAWCHGLRLCPSHVALAHEVQKDKAFNSCLTDNDTVLLAGTEQLTLEDPLRLSFGAFEKGEPAVFLTRSPLLSHAECARAIHLAERHAQDTGGWTTARHYAVPTTDLPLYAVPDLLRWFRNAMADRIGPLLASQFPDTKGRLQVLDAFIVKYHWDESSGGQGSQWHLPLHRDQSSHSLTIALNPASEYEGGGTFFADFGAAVRPEEGHVLSFRGDLLHSGDPVCRGTRYILAVFLFGSEAKGGKASGAGSEVARVFSGLKRKNEQTEQEVVATSSSFSFSFFSNDV